MRKPVDQNIDNEADLEIDLLGSIGYKIEHRTRGNNN
jgi:hypothetical protein